ncbi:MAG: c-type cytochrome [Gammaproteobacteria bacterium]|nr:c-type cytochrome [Gammaproteobacteria bacterium]
MSANDASKDYQKVCAACHGENASGVAGLNSPALAGQQADYIVRQVALYQQGIRGKQDGYAAQMAAISTTLESQGIDEQRLNDIADYLSSMPSHKNSVSAGDAALGYKQYQSSCGGCHGDKAQGNKSLNSPRLAGIDPQYLMRQYLYYVEGKRGLDKRNRFGRQMAMMAQTVRDPQKIRDVFAYISSINSESD